MKTVIAAALLALGLSSIAQAATTFLNVSYDPTREFYQEYNQALVNIGNSVRVKRSILNNRMVVQANRQDR